MSYRFEFPAVIDRGRIELPAEIASRLALRGIERVQVIVTSLPHVEERMAGRGIDDGTVDRVATAQSIDPDVAGVVLSGEGIALGSRIEADLRRLAGERS